MSSNDGLNLGKGGWSFLDVGHTLRTKVAGEEVLL
jgi:hypothetical protein